MTHPTFDHDTFTLTTHDGAYLLRPVQVSDAPNLRARCADPQNTQYLLHLQAKAHQSISDVESWIQNVRNGFNKDSLLLVIVDTTTNEVIGEGPLGFINWEEKWCESGVMIDHYQSGKGVATKVLNETVDFAFTELGLEQVKYGTLKDNKGMAKVLMEKLRIKGEPVENQRKDGLWEYKFVFKKEDWLRALQQSE